VASNLSSYSDNFFLSGLMELREQVIYLIFFLSLGLFSFLREARYPYLFFTYGASKLAVLRILDFYAGSLIRIFPSQIQGQKDPGSGSASKNFVFFYPKNCFYALGKIIMDVHPGSRILTRIFSHPRSRNQKSTFVNKFF
jgi:hypothetical protein